MTNEGGHINIKVINAGNCVMCGREIKIATKKENNRYPNIFFCPRCEKHREKKDKAETERKMNDE